MDPDIDGLPLYRHQYFLGCPVWSCADWKGTAYSVRAPQKTWLSQYSETFGTVEGNTTFYAIPAPETVERWATSVKPGFRFALKFPGVVTHDKGLLNVDLETGSFLDGLEILHQHDCLGPTFIQFPNRFGPDSWQLLEKFLRNLPEGFPFAVEVRNEAWFVGDWQQKLNSLLEELALDRVIFDSRPLFSQKAIDGSEARAQSRKPRLPVVAWATGRFPFLRLIGNNQRPESLPHVAEWAQQVAQWIQDGKTPFVFAHAPHEKHAPELARHFHSKLAECLGKESELEFPNQSDEQMSLF